MKKTLRLCQLDLYMQLDYVVVQSVLNRDAFTCVLVIKLVPLCCTPVGPEHACPVRRQVQRFLVVG